MSFLAVSFHFVNYLVAFGCNMVTIGQFLVTRSGFSFIRHDHIHLDRIVNERSGSVVECLTRDRGAAGSSLTGVTALCP